MAARALWKGHLRFSLVTVPIRVYAATNASANISFNQLHRECMTRIQYRKWCPTHEREVTNDEIVKGYEFERGRYVALEQDDIAKVRPESTRVINLSQFTEAEQLDPVLIDEPYYLAPDGKVAAESFAVLREALKGKAAIGQVAIHGRERLVAIEPREKGMIMFTLRRKDEIRGMDNIDELDGIPEKVKAEETTLARRVMSGFEGDLNLDEFHDTYEEALKTMIEAKVEGEEIVTPEVEAPPRVVNLMDALRKSLDQVSKDKKRPARAPAAATTKRTRATGSAKKRAS
jgi:DNA end-binding protein Ku